jgi:hypothetical protein
MQEMLPAMVIKINKHIRHALHLIYLATKLANGK